MCVPHRIVYVAHIILLSNVIPMKSIKIKLKRHLHVERKKERKKEKKESHGKIANCEQQFSVTAETGSHVPLS